jgi:hypothetical protein
MNTRRSGLVWWGAMVVLCVAVAYGIVQVRHVLDELSGARNDRDALAQQVRDMGGVPTVGPKGEDGNDGERGADGRDGQPGGDGTPGVRENRVLTVPRAPLALTEPTDRMVFPGGWELTGPAARMVRRGLKDLRAP